MIVETEDFTSLQSKQEKLTHRIFPRFIFPFQFWRRKILRLYKIETGKIKFHFQENSIPYALWKVKPENDQKYIAHDFS